VSSQAPENAYGGPGYGLNPFGPAPGPLSLQGAVASVENVVRLYFSEPVYFSGLLDALDASLPSLYAVAPAADSPPGLDGSAAQSVSVLYAAVGEDPNSIDLFLDRPLSPYPCEYVATVDGVADVATLTPIGPVSVAFVGVYRVVEAVQPDALYPSRDFANPQTASDQATSSTLLGTFPVDDSGDYGVDQGLVSYKKRILRRLLTRKNGFAFLPGYGVGVPSYGKRLARASVRSVIASDAESQIAQEPETASVAVQVLQSPVDPGLFYVVVAAKTRSGGSIKFAAPFAT
jgi:hypothetical protein